MNCNTTHYRANSSSVPGDPTVSGATLVLGAATNIGANQTVQIGANGTTISSIGVTYNGSLPGNIVRTGSTPLVLAINTGATPYTTAIDQSTFLSGGNFLGSTTTGTYGAATLTPAADSTYRLGGGGGTLTIATAVLTGSSTVQVNNSALTNGSGTVVLTAANNLAGRVNVNTGTLRLAGMSGSLLNAGIFVDRGATLTLDSSASGNTGIHRAGSVTLSHGSLAVTGNVGASSSDTISSLSLLTTATTQPPTITMNAVNDATKSTRLQIGSIDRPTYVVPLVRGGGLGGNTFGNSISNIFVTSGAPGVVGGGGAAGSTNVSIVPWIVGGTTASDNGSTLVTYGASGIRPLTSAEYATNFSGDATNNVRVDTAVSLSSSATVNSLVVNNVALTGSTVNVTSGAVLLLGGSVNATSLNFGSAQGVLGYTVSRNLQSASVLTLAGTGGLVIHSPTGANFDFAAASTYRGDTYIHGSMAVWGSNVLPYASSVLTGSEGTRTGDIHLYGTLGMRANHLINGLYGTGSLTGAGSGTVTISIGDNNANGDFSGTLSDFGTLNVNKIGTGTLVMSGVNSTHIGITSVSGGKLQVSLIANGGDVSTLGNGTNTAGRLVITNGATLSYSGAATSSDKLFTIGTTANGGSGIVEASGTGALTFTNSGAIAYGTAGATGTAQRRTLILSGSNTDANTLSPLIGQNGPATNGNSDVNLIKEGVGRWVIGNANTYRGSTSINAGTLQVSSGGALGATATADIYVAGGAILQLDGTNAIDNLADLFLATNADVVLNGAGSETVYSLWLNGVSQAMGTYGATGSGADFINDDYFAGSGTLSVVPEPASMSLVALAAGALLTRRRRSR